MKRYKLTIEYDGSNFSGWQIQPNGRTVEEEIEKAFSQILQQPIDIIGQGRTDAGVHAKGQVAHVDLPEIENLQKLIFGVNGLVGDEIHLAGCEPVHMEFHSRFDAVSRNYEYRVLTAPSPLLRNHGWYAGRNLNRNVLDECARLLMGEHDFNGFSKFNEENYTTLCSVFESTWREEAGALVFSISANRFLRNMVRRLVGTMIEVAKGKTDKGQFRTILDHAHLQSNTVTAPARGLVLMSVDYEKKSK